MQGVTRRRRLGLVAVIVLALGANAAYAVPAQTAAELRAVSHCTRHTGRPATVPDARHCCRVRAEATTPATIAATPPLEPPVVLALPAASPASALALAAPSCLERPRRSREGPPLFLGLRTLRC